MSQALRRSRGAPKRGLKVVSSCLCRSCVCVSEELADVWVHNTTPIDVVSIHRGSVEGCQHTLSCVCVLEGADDELIDGVPSDEAVELLLCIHLLECKCVCHVCHVSVCICERHRGESNPSLHHVCLCRCLRGNHPLRFRQRLGRSHPEGRRSGQRHPCPSEMGHRRSPSMSV